MLRCRLDCTGMPPCGRRCLEALVALSDEEVTRIVAVAIGETLMADSAVVDAAGTKIGVCRRTV